MKKLLSLISAFSIVGSGVIPVVACSNNNTAADTIKPPIPQTDQQKADAIKNKITKTVFTVPTGTQFDASAPETKVVIDKYLQKVNPALTSEDLSYINYQGTLKTGIDSSISLNIKVGNSGSDSLKITIKIYKKQWIKNTTVPAGAFTSPKLINDVWFIGTNEGLYTSTDGNNWTQNKDIPDDAWLFDTPVFINGAYYLGTSSKYAVGRGFYTSQDGHTWKRIESIPYEDSSSISPVFINGTYFLSTFQNGLYTSTDGDQWTRELYPDPEKTGVGFYLESNVVYIDHAYYLGSVLSGLWTASDRKSWIKVSDDQIPQKGSLDSSPVKIGDTYFACVNSHSGAYFGLKTGVYTTQNGKNWTFHDVSLEGYFIDPYFIQKINNLYYLSTNAGLLTSENLTNWSLLTSNTGMLTEPITKFGNIYYLGINYNYRGDSLGLWTSNDGKTWTQDETIPTKSRIYGYSTVLINDTYYVSTDGNGLYSSPSI